MRPNSIPAGFFSPKKTGGGEKIRDVYPYVPMGTHSAVVFLGVGLNGCLKENTEPHRGMTGAHRGNLPRL